MAYEKQTFIDQVKDAIGNILVEGTKLQAEHLNHIEDGIVAVETTAGAAATAAAEAKTAADAAAAKAAEATSWDDITDEPFSGKVYADYCDLSSKPAVYFDTTNYRFYKVSDVALTYEQMLKTVFCVGLNASDAVIPTAETFAQVTEQCACFLPIGSSTVGDYPIAAVYTTEEITADGVTVSAPEIGLYFAAKWENGLVQPWPMGNHYSDGELVTDYCAVAFYCDDTNLHTLPPVTASDNGKQLVVSGGEWTAKEVEETAELPSVTTDDNGKLLQVVDGVWSAVAITDGNSVAY